MSLLLAGLAMGAPVWAQAQDEANTLKLQPSTQLQETLPESAQGQTPSFVSGQRMQGQTAGAVVVEGAAELRRHDLVIQADRLEFDQSSQDAQAQGNVLINRGGNRFTGPSLQINVETQKGHFDQPVFSLPQNDGHGEASRVDFLGDNKLEATDARYSTCPRPISGAWKPDWQVRASRIELDNNEEVGTATNGVLEFKGVPVLGAPYLSFPLTDKRKSGLLPPTINLDTTSGLELTLPYYLDLSPEYDATLYPTYMSKRGVDLAGEFRYLQPGYQGQVRAAYMPNDQLRDIDRWGLSVEHSQNVPTHVSLGGLSLDSPLGLRLKLNRVSDDDYWSDFPRSSTSLTSRLLANEAVASLNQGPWSFSVGAYRWQTLQSTDSTTITPPYDRLPNVALRFAQDHQSWAGLSGWKWSFDTDYTRFQADSSLTEQVNGARSMAIGRIAHRWDTSGWYLEPSMQVHHTSYRFDSALSDGALTASRTVPTVSVDSGLVLEREASYFGRRFTQTLEPRAFFTWTPYRDQSTLPNYDSAAYDFDFATIYNANSFGGNDRIADLRALTVGATSRLLDPDTGAEVVRLGVAQRYLLDDQTVVLPTQSCDSTDDTGCSTVSNGLSDVLLGASVQWSPRWSTSASVQLSTDDGQSERTTLNLRYTPSPYRVLSTAYRLKRGTSEQLDIGWQWPLSDLWSDSPATSQRGRALGSNQWYSVGRLNYSLLDKKVVDLVAGFEYDAGCWIGRMVFERLTTSSSTTTQRVLFQIEFSGFTRLGSSPLETLRTNVPRYQYLREDINPPSRFENYD